MKSLYKKTSGLLLFFLFIGNVFAQDIPEKKIDTEVNEVTVFLEGAQITRKKSIDLVKGKTIIRFVNLSPYIDPKSIQVKAEGELTVLSVNHSQNFINKLEKSAELTELEKQVEAIKGKIKIETTYLSIIKGELSFLEENSDIGGKNEQLNIANLQQASEFYSNKLTSLKLKEIERSETLAQLELKKNDLEDQIKTLSDKKEYPSGEILVKADAKQAGKYSFEVSYLVGSAGWFPSYDIRAKNINEPVQLIYKANVKQNTREDWTNVKLKFSSADPNISGISPELKPYYLNYNSVPPSYGQVINSVKGKVMDSEGESLPGANVVVTGTTIGTVADMEGNYSITIPNNSRELTFSFIGFSSQTIPITGSQLNVALEEDAVSLDEVVVTAYGINRTEDQLQGRVAGVGASNSKIKIRSTSSLAIEGNQVENQTTVDFEIKMPYTVNSDNKNYTVDMEVYDLPAIYQYYSAPKVDKAAFLIANVVEWEKYNLLEGEANVFFEDTYIGKTLMDVRYASDTLEISLGRDKSITVNREKIKEFTTKQLMGTKKEETRAWKTTVKNNKNQEISMIILDQVPVSTLEEIEVNVQNTSGAKHNAESGEIKWELKLKPGDKKELELKYSVKYPKYRNLIIE